MVALWTPYGWKLWLKPRVKGSKVELVDGHDENPLRELTSQRDCVGGGGGRLGHIWTEHARRTNISFKINSYFYWFF